MTRTDVTIPSRCPISAAFLMPVPTQLLSAPLDYIAAEHARQRCVCAYLKQMADEKKVARADAEAVIVFMTEDLIRHHEDEDVDLFPALRRRASREDSLDAMLDRLAQDHASIEKLARSIVSALKRLLDGPGVGSAIIDIGKAGRKAMTLYSASLLQHLSVENGIALVFARKRLTAYDLAAISRSMTARRGGPASV